MSTQDTRRKPEGVNHFHGKPFAQMTPGEKLKFVGKLIVSIMTFGFVFPTILND
jgi:hypothetical protein